MCRVLLFIFMLVLSPVLLAQRPMARVYLKSGKVVEGAVLKADDEKVVLQLTEMEITISAAEIERVEQVNRADGSTPAPTPPDPVVAPDPKPEPERTKPVRPRSGKAMPVAPAEQAADEGGPDRHISRWIDRYLWLIPQTVGHRASVGAALLLVLALVLHWSTKVAGLESATFGRNALIAVLVFVGLIVQLSLDVENPLLVVTIMFTDLMLWYVIVRMVLGAGPLSATVMLVCCLLSGLLGVLSLEVMGYVIQQHDRVS